jgi:hypothetical protein
MANQPDGTNLLAQAFPDLYISDQDQVVGTDLLATALPNLSIQDQGRAILFPHFARLPYDITRFIWREHARDQAERDVEIELENGYITRSRTPTPAVLHVSRESRRETLKFFGILHTYNPYTGMRKPIYFHPETDTIVFHERKFSMDLFNSCLLPPIPIFYPTQIPPTGRTIRCLTQIFSREPDVTYRFLFNGVGNEELAKIKKLKFTNIRLDKELASWIKTIPELEVNNSPFTFPPFSGATKLTLVMEKLPPWAEGGTPAGAARDKLTSDFVGLFKDERGPKVYDATDRLSITMLNRHEELVAVFWAESYDHRGSPPEANLGIL